METPNQKGIYLSIDKDAQKQTNLQYYDVAYFTKDVEKIDDAEGLNLFIVDDGLEQKTKIVAIYQMDKRVYLDHYSLDSDLPQGNIFANCSSEGDYKYVMQELIKEDSCGWITKETYIFDLSAFLYGLEVNGDLFLGLNNRINRMINETIGFDIFHTN